MRITEITRRDIIDAIAGMGVVWAGRLKETDFLARLYDLNSIESHDSRFRDAEADIWQHRVANPMDWSDDWVFDDDRFRLLAGDDDLFLRFLCETIHPSVRPNVAEAENLGQLYNSMLKNDGFRLIERSRMSNKPVYAGQYVGVDAASGLASARATLGEIDSSSIDQQIRRMEAGIDSDPDLAIGTAKEFVETICRTVLRERNIDEPSRIELAKLVRLTSKELRLTPEDIPEAAKAAETIKRLLSNLATITQGLAELRNRYGTGHGKEAGLSGLRSRHAKLAVGAASTLAVFLFETHQAKE